MYVLWKPGYLLCTGYYCCYESRATCSTVHILATPLLSEEDTCWEDSTTATDNSSSPVWKDRPVDRGVEVETVERRTMVGAREDISLTEIRTMGCVHLDNVTWTQLGYRDFVQQVDGDQEGQGSDGHQEAEEDGEEEEADVEAVRMANDPETRSSSWSQDWCLAVSV